MSKHNIFKQASAVYVNVNVLARGSLVDIGWVVEPSKRHVQSICISITIYDEDSWDADDILDFVPDGRNGIDYEFDLTTGFLSDDGEGIFVEYFDNRGQNSLSILVEYEFSRIAIED